MAGAPTGSTERPSAARQLMKILPNPVRLIASHAYFLPPSPPLLFLTTGIPRASPVLFVILIIDLFDLEIVVAFQFADHLPGIPGADRLHDPIMDVEHQLDAREVLPEVFPAHADPERLDRHVEEFLHDCLDDPVLGEI